MNINTTKIMKSNYNSSDMGRGKNKNGKRRMKNFLQAKVNHTLDKIIDYDTD